jgi:hypothetical protein
MSDNVGDTMNSAREVFLGACEKIAGSLQTSGFCYAPSGPHVTRRRGEWIDTIRFQSSHKNSPGTTVKLWIHVRLGNLSYRKWKHDVGSPLGTRDHLAGAQIGNLRRPPTWLDLNLEPESTRSASIGDAVRVVRDVGLPFFGLSDDLDALFEQLSTQDVPGFEPHDAFEFALFASGQQTAERIFRGTLKRLPGFAARVIRDLEQLVNPANGTKRLPFKATQLARVVAHHDCLHLLEWAKSDA